MNVIEERANMKMQLIQSEWMKESNEPVKQVRRIKTSTVVTRLTLPDSPTICVLF